MRKKTIRTAQGTWRMTTIVLKNGKKITVNVFTENKWHRSPK